MGDEGGGGAVGAEVVDTGVSDITGASWLGVNVMGAFGLQPESSAGIKTSATRILRFILFPTQVGDFYG